MGVHVLLACPRSDRHAPVGLRARAGRPSELTCLCPSCGSRIEFRDTGRGPELVTGQLRPLSAPHVVVRTAAF